MYEPMSDLGSQLSDRELAELAALADGTLPADRRRSTPSEDKRARRE
jgi:hypothetical protein